MLLEKEIQISPAEFQLWLDHPTTSTILEALMDERGLWSAELCFGNTLRTTNPMVDTAEATGIVKGLTMILEDLRVYLQNQWEEAARLKAEMEEEGGE